MKKIISKARFIFQIAGLSALLIFPLMLKANPPGLRDTIPDEQPRIYLQCMFCDIDHIKRKIDYVNYVRDRKDAEIHVQINRENAANSGERYTVFFLGQKRFASTRDTLQFNVGPETTEEQERQQIVHALKAGLTPYLLQTGLWKNMALKYSGSGKKQEVKDKWNYWIFEIGTNGRINSEESQKGFEVEGSFEASKVTRDIKLEFDHKSEYEKDIYEVDSNTITSIHRSHDFEALGVKSLTQHWSAGGVGGIYSSRYRNIRISYRMAPAVEFNIFPYEEATTRQLTFLYRLEFEHNFYKDTTIYNKIQQKVLQQSVEVDYELKKPWGSVDAGINYSHYLHDLSKQRLDFFGSVGLNLVKGLSVYFYSSLSLIHDQLSLPKGDATQEEILTRQQQLATSYSYHAGFGISYTFGSMYNNIVNPRF